MLVAFSTCARQSLLHLMSVHSLASPRCAAVHDMHNRSPRNNSASVEQLCSATTVQLEAVQQRSIINCPKLLAVNDTVCTVRHTDYTCLLLCMATTSTLHKYTSVAYLEVLPCIHSCVLRAQCYNACTS
jgi:hypothetical protein